MRKGKSQRPRRAKPPERPRPPSIGNQPPGLLTIHGLHAVRAALENPRRRVHRLLATADSASELSPAVTARRAIKGKKSQILVETLPKAELMGLVPEGAVHQGAILSLDPLAQPSLEELIEGPGEDGKTAPQVVLALDQVTDPRNVGAILRSAAAFGATAVIAPKRHAPDESGVLAKAASGGLERVAYLRVGNLGQALRQFQKAGFWTVGLAAEGHERLDSLRSHKRLVLVLGAEGTGLRRLTREHCDHLVCLPTRPDFGQLNVSAAAAVALYALLGQA